MFMTVPEGVPVCWWPADLGAVTMHNVVVTLALGNSLNPMIGTAFSYKTGKQRGRTTARNLHELEEAAAAATLKEAVDARLRAMDVMSHSMPCSRSRRKVAASVMSDTVAGEQASTVGHAADADDGASTSLTAVAANDTGTIV
ncbi:uncharacterized protein B0H18DRAFT_1114173 [Fomitopsis serialis]|uniref:uncharacterized protein n=1 Tax=Fomitopsis serialis TaxID=139415 RepID=UPI002008E88B|nr:uncharacterized protein B0H18DRAFT_1114173 [Neoantrodia serialis]KAH9935424.1 hypothetical protein B0H18DRAFT_1114173 [Neoantrodia serialis]